MSPENNSLVDWDVGEFDQNNGQWIRDRARNIKWVTRPGSITCGDPVVADRLIWVGTINTSFDSRNDASILACFRENDPKTALADRTIWNLGEL